VYQFWKEGIVRESMPKSPKAPPGFYSASEAIKKLGLPRSTFYDLVEKGTIKKIVPPGRSDGYYLKAAIDDLAKARQLFTLQYANLSSVFQKATEEDVQGIYDVCVSLWGTRGTYPYELRLARYRKNPSIFYVLKYMDFVVGFTTAMPITKRAIDEIMKGEKRAWEAIILDDILPFEPKAEIDYLFLEIAVRDEVPKPKQFGMRLLSGTIRALEEFAEQGTVVKNLFAISSTSDGIELCREFGFKEFPLPPDGRRLAFLLEVASSQSPYLHDYQQIVKKRHTKTDTQ
jgi:predicted DNA-binding transcriptional regulator AlpA